MTEQDEVFGLTCAEVRDGLSARLDGAVDAAEDAALRHHLERCVHCAGYERNLRELDARMRRHLTGRCDEDAIWARVRTGIEADGGTEAARARSRPWRVAGPVTRWAAAAVVVMCLALAGWQMLRPDGADGSILTATVQDFSDFRSSGDVLDVAAAHPDAVLRWMTARVDFALPQRLAAPAGLRIAGGRLCSFLSRKLAFFSYSAGDTGVGLYITPAEGLDVPPDGSFVSVARTDGLTAVSWHRDGLAYVVVSRLPIGDLTAFAEHFRQRNGRADGEGALTIGHVRDGGGAREVVVAR